MKIEKINETMNCKCLQKIIENDKVKHTFSKDEHGIKTTQTAESVHIIFECITNFRIKKNSIKNDSLVNKNDEEQCGIPFFYCPLCGTKTKNNIPESGFYSQFNKEYE